MLPRCLVALTTEYIIDAKSVNRIIETLERSLTNMRVKQSFIIDDSIELVVESRNKNHRFSLHHINADQQCHTHPINTTRMTADGFGYVFEKARPNWSVDYQISLNRSLHSPSYSIRIVPRRIIMDAYDRIDNYDIVLIPTPDVGWLLDPDPTFTRVVDNTVHAYVMPHVECVYRYNVPDRIYGNNGTVYNGMCLCLFARMTGQDRQKEKLVKLHFYATDKPDRYRLVAETTIDRHVIRLTIPKRRRFNL